MRAWPGALRFGKVILGSSEWCGWGLWGRPGRGACPNLPQRHPAARSAANETAEYQRFFSHAPARSRSLWQIWTTGAAADRPGRAFPASARPMMSTPAWASARRAVADRADAPFDRAAPTRAPPGPRAGTPDPRDRHLTYKNVPLADVLTGYPAISRVTRRSHGPPRRSPGAPHHRLSRMAGRRLACRDAADPFGSLACRWTTIFREPGSLFSGRLRAFPGKDIMMIHPHEA